MLVVAVTSSVVILGVRLRIAGEGYADGRSSKFPHARD
jgi:hypothetical protein